MLAQRLSTALRQPVVDRRKHQFPLGRGARPQRGNSGQFHQVRKGQVRCGQPCLHWCRQPCAFLRRTHREIGRDKDDPRALQRRKRHAARLVLRAGRFGLLLRCGGLPVQRPQEAPAGRLYRQEALGREAVDTDRERIASYGMDPIGGTSAEFARIVRLTASEWPQMVKAVPIQVE